MLNGSTCILSTSDEGDVSRILEEEADLIIKLEEDVGGHGRVRVVGGGETRKVLWRTIQGKIEFRQQISI